MSRPKGSKNAPAKLTNPPKFDPFGGAVEVKQDLSEINEIVKTGNYEIEHSFGNYVICTGKTPDELQTTVNILLKEYQCHGGVSVTNYRGLDGNIVMVYCQALIRVV